MQVKWYRSLRVKLFVMMSIYLLATVLGISWQNSRVFKEMLDRQNQDNLIGIAKKGAYSVSGMLELWSSLAYSVMHNVASANRAAFESSVQSFLSSNREAISFQLISVNESGKVLPVLYRSTEYTDSPRFEGRFPPEISAKIKEIGMLRVINQQKNKDEKSFTENLVADTRLPLLQLGYPFQIKAQKLVYWAVLTVWQDRIASHLEHSLYVKSYVVGQGGQTFLTHAKDSGSVNQLQANIRELLASKSEFGFKSISDAQGKDLLLSYSLIPNSGLTFVVEQKASAEYEYLNFRIRKIALFAWIFLLLTVMGSYLAANKITKGIDAVARTALEIAQGNLNARSLIRSWDEVGLLSLSVNHMAAKINSLLIFQVEVARQEKELRTAQAVQGTLFPKNSPATELIRVAGHYEPASECAGDWWGHFRLSASKSIFVIADATGHGAPAALLVAIVFAYFQTLVALFENGENGENENIKKNFTDPAYLMKNLNQIFWKSGEGSSTMTMFIGVLDSDKGTISFVNAGHVNPLIIPAQANDGRLTEKRSGGSAKVKRILPLVGHGTPLGYKVDPEYQTFSTEVFAGDKLFFYTDGLVECTNQEQIPFGGRAVKTRLSDWCDLSAEDVMEKMLHDAREYFGECPRADDITVAVAEISPLWNTLLNSKMDSRQEA